MYLRGSKWNMNRRTRRSNPWRVLLLAALVVAAFYLTRFKLPEVAESFVPTPTPTTSAESFANEADNLFNTGKLLPAIDAYQQSIRSDPKNKANFVALARAQIFAGQYKQALENAERALVGNDDYSLAHAVRGWALNFLQQYGDAALAEQKAISLDANNPLAHAFYAEVLVNRNDYGDLDKASSESKLALDLGPNLLETLRARGYVLYVTGNYPESLAKYQAAIGVNKNIADLYLYSGYNYIAMQDQSTDNTDLAIQSFLQAKSLNPTDPIPDLELSRIYLQLGAYEKAIQYADNAVKSDPQNPLRYGNLGMLYYKKGDMEKAINSLSLAVRGGNNTDGVAVKGAPLDNSWMATYYWYYGFALAKADRCQEAIPIFRALLTGVPDNQLAVENANAGLDLCASGAAAKTATPSPAKVTPTKP
jgi:tetratricopeptide (TPR) repeat protein